MTLPTAFDAASTEARIYAQWEESGCFRAGANSRPGAPPYCIVIPPPNVTGALHMGHALNSTLQDILIRWHRMRGFDTLFQPGVDHAGIATQMVVERELERAGEPGRRELGREEFLKWVWAWKGKSGGAISDQFRRLGVSFDWSRDRFTMDEGLSRAVRIVFVRLFEQGLIYRDKRLVNWDPQFETAISDLEVEQVEVQGTLWHFRYPLEDGSGHIEVATTRPETMLGDTGVAVHPDDDRYAPLVGRRALLPLVGRRIRIVADAHADPETGSGAVKITPAHDFDDFKVGKRTGLPAIRIMDDKAQLSLVGNTEFLEGIEPGESLDEVLALHGLDRFDARKRIVAMMAEKGFLVREEPILHSVPHGDRSKKPVEPHLTDQWFVDTAALAEEALQAVRDGRTVFHPKNWENDYYRWLENIEPWCVSRQLWWGHQIPVWYGPDNTPFAAESAEEADEIAARHYGKPVQLRQDEDVLDTWFSSALWPFSTLGWPDPTPELMRYYPTSVLVTAFDIIFFWVARMMMVGLYIMPDEEGRGEVPFGDVYVHAIVRDGEGRKMSKSLGNVIDPIAMIDRFGADAVRFTLAAMAAKGRDIRLSEERTEGYRNFVTKLWNAARFVMLKEGRYPADFEAGEVIEPVNQWIVGKLEKAREEVDEALADYRFDDAARALHHVVRREFCDWYIELSKGVFGAGTEAACTETKSMLGWSLDRILTMLHPFMPFVTEELWQLVGEPGPGRAGPLIHAPWPQAVPSGQSAPASREIDWLVTLIDAVRSVRADIGVQAATKVPLTIVPETPEIGKRVARHEVSIGRIARVVPLVCADRAPDRAVSIVLDEATAYLGIDLPAERKRLEGQIERIDKEIEGFETRLANQQFVERAKPEVVAECRDRLAGRKNERARVWRSLERLLALDTEDERR